MSDLLRIALGVTVAALVLLCLGCGGGTRELASVDTEDTLDTAAATLPTAHLLPLAAGNWWIYKELRFPMGSVSAAEAEAPDLSTKGVEVETIIANDKGPAILEQQRWEEVHKRYMCQGLVVREYWRHNKLGTLMRHCDVLAGAYQLKKPLKPGMKWQNPADNSIMSIFAVNATVTTKAFTFRNCTVVTKMSNGPGDYWTKYYYCPSIGIVRMVQFKGSQVIGRTDLWDTNVGF